jgi:hypothetical protein
MLNDPCSTSTASMGSSEPNMYLITRLALKLGAVVVLAVVGLFGAGICAATRQWRRFPPN